MRYIDTVPDGWYEFNRIQAIYPAPTVTVYRKENRGGGLFGLTMYYVDVDGVETIVPQSFFAKLAGRHTIHYINEYKYVAENGNTYNVWDTDGVIQTDMPQ